MEKIAQQKYYAVAVGKKTGIFLTWPECQKQVSGYPGAKYKSFSSQAQAQAWLKQDTLLDKKILSRNSVEKEFDIYLYTDGGSRNHGNKKGEHVKANDKAAWAFLLRRQQKKYTQVGGAYGKTNNAMEITALLNALRLIVVNGWQDERISVTLDSKYVLDAVTKGWLQNWQKKGWKTAGGKNVANQELWQELQRFLVQCSNIAFNWTKGHANNPGNNYVDQLLNQQMDAMPDKKI